MIHILYRIENELSRTFVVALYAKYVNYAQLVELRICQRPCAAAGVIVNFGIFDQNTFSFFNCKFAIRLYFDNILQHRAVTSLEKRMTFVTNNI